MTLLRARAALLAVAALIAAALLLARASGTGAAGGTDWLTYGFDLARSGYNPAESTLSPGNVGALTPLWSADSFGPITAQPLYAGAVTINGQATDVVYAANGSGYVNAFDAASGTLLWRKQFGVASTQCPFGVQSHGITGAPVIDRATNRIYFVDGLGKAYALDLSSGATVAGWPVSVIANPSIEMVWSALTLANGRLYTEVGSPCDNPGSRGRVVAINPATAQITHTFLVVDPSHGEGGNIWPYGGVSADPSGRVYTASGNAVDPDENLDYANAVLALSADLGLVAWDRPANIPSSGDFDFGSTPVLFQAPGCPPQFTVTNKNGFLYLYNRDQVASGARQQLKISTGDLIGLSAYWPPGNLVYSPVDAPSPSGLKPGLVAHTLGSDCQLHQVWNAPLGGNATFSSATVANGVVYVGTGENNGVVALDARSGAQLWSASAAKQVYVPPVVVNGRVYVASWDQHVYAYAPGSAPPPTPPPPPPTPPPTGGLIANPSFEVDLSNWYGWQSVLSRVQGGHQGDWAARVAFACPSGATCDAYTIDDAPDTVPNPKQGDIYTASAWVRADGATGKRVRIILRELGGAAPVDSSSGRPVTLTAAWQQLTVTRRVAATGRDSLGVYISQADPTPGDRFVVDEIAMSRLAAPPQETLTVDPLAGPGDGSVTSSPAGIACGPAGGACTAQFAFGTRVTLSAAPAAGYSFDGWSEADSGPDAGCDGVTSSTCSIALDDAYTVQAHFGAPTTLAAGPAVVQAGAPVAATWSRIVTTSARDWVGLYRPGAADSAYLTWGYIRNGGACTRTPATPAQNGSCALPTLALNGDAVPAGAYELRLFRNDSFRRLAVSGRFSVAPAGLVVAGPDSQRPGVALPGGRVRPTWQGSGAPTALDWVGVYRPGTPDDIAHLVNNNWGNLTDAGACTRQPGKPLAQGSCDLPLDATLAPGAYQLRLFRNGTFNRLAASNTFSVLPPTLTAGPSVQGGAPVRATWADIGGPSAGDWIGLYRPGAPDAQLLAWNYVGQDACTRTRTRGLAAGACDFPLARGLAAGTYELRLFRNDTFARLAVSNAFGIAARPTSLAAGPASVDSGAAINAAWTDNAGPTATDWVGLYRPGAADTDYLTWGYLRGGGACTHSAGQALSVGACTLAAQSLTGDPLPAGAYELRLFRKDGFTRLAVSNAVGINAPLVSVAGLSAPAGGSVALTWQAIGHPTPGDWVGLFPLGATDTGYVTWGYLSGSAACTRSAGQPRAAGACSLALQPLTGNLTPGAYELRLFANDGFTRLAVSNTFGVSLPRGAAPAPSAPAPGPGQPGHVPAATTPPDAGPGPGQPGHRTPTTGAG